MIKFEFLNRIRKRIKNIKIGKLFYSNKFVAVFSVLLSFIIWVCVASNGSESVPVVIGDIPVDIQLSENAVQDGLQVFGAQNITARVEIKGNRFVVGQVTKDNIQVSATQSAMSIMSPGNYTLELSAKKVGVLQDYEIVGGVKPSVITVMVDRYRETEFNVESEINFNPKAGYFVGATTLSSPKVTLSGPETEISKIKKVKVASNIPGEVSTPLNFKLPIVMYDAYDKVITSETIKCSANEVDVNIPVLMKKEFSIVPKFSNLPSEIDFNHTYKDAIKITPSKLEIAGPEDVISTMKNITLEEVDFRSVNMQSCRFKLPINLPQGCRSLNNVYEADLFINMYPFREKVITINQFEYKGVPEGKTANVYNGSINVTVLAPARVINYIKPSDIVAEIDFSDKKDFSSSMETPINVYVKELKDVWVSGEYRVNVNLS